MSPICAHLRCCCGIHLEHNNTAGHPPSDHEILGDFLGGFAVDRRGWKLQRRTAAPARCAIATLGDFVGGIGPKTAEDDGSVAGGDAGATGIERRQLGRATVDACCCCWRLPDKTNHYHHTQQQEPSSLLPTIQSGAFGGRTEATAAKAIAAASPAAYLRINTEICR